MSTRGDANDALAGTRAIYIRGEHYPAVNVYDRGKLLPGSTLDGPAVIEQGDATILVQLSFRDEVKNFGDLILERSEQRRARKECASTSTSRESPMNNKIKI